MKRLAGVLVWGLAIVPLGALAQSLPDLQVNKEDGKGTTLGGKTSIDLIRLESKVPSVPLRNAGVIAGSEELELDGRPLAKGTDYGIDYASGMVYLMVVVRDGQSLRARYRFDPALAKSTPTSNSFNSLKLSFGSGATATMGLGMVERRPDGTVMRSDLYSLRTNFSPAGGMGVHGVIAMGSRSRTDSSSMFERTTSQDPGTMGKGSAIIQGIDAKLAGGTISTNYQAVDRNFTGTSAFTDAGYSDADAAQLAKERGLRRFSFGMQGVQIGGLKFNQVLDTVGDGTNGITRRAFGAETKGFKVGYDYRTVNAGFVRFNDLREQDRELLRREAGLTSQSWFGDFGSKSFNLAFNSKMIENAASNAFIRRSLSFGTGVVKINYSDQKVENGFTSFAGIREADWQQVARESGVRREAWSFNLGPISKQLQGLDVSQSQFRATSGEISAMDLNARGQNWGIEHHVRAIEAGMNEVAKLSGPEVDANLTTIAKMYDPNGIGIRPEDRNWYFGSGGLSRSGTRFTYTRGTFNLRADEVRLSGQNDSGTVTGIYLNQGKTSLSFRSQDFGANLTEISTMTLFERERLGMVAGLHRTDLNFSTALSGQRTLAIENMEARVGEADAGRTAVNYHDKGFDLRYVNRHVGDQFAFAGQLIDPERQILQNMQGGEQRQIQLNWNLMKQASVKLDWAQGNFDSTGVDTVANNTLVNLNPDRFTKFEWYQYQGRQTDASDLLFANNVNRLRVDRAIPNLGAVSYEHETRQFDGNTTAIGSDRTSVSVETQLTKGTSVRTDDTQTRFDNGDRENIRTHTISTEILRGTGVSVSDTNITRTGALPDERKRNYGFWLNLGKGVRLTYGYNRALNDSTAGTLNSTVGLTGGTLGDWNFGAANYQIQRWDQTRNRTLGNFSLSTSKPLAFGPFKEFRFSMGTDTIRDYSVWNRENNIANLATKFLGVDIGFDYLSQYHAQLHDRAIDRVFRVQTNQDPKLPLRASVMYKVRTLPSDQHYDIRNLSLTARIAPGYELTHILQTYPEVARGDVLLGSVVQPLRMLSWRLDQKTTANTRFSATWDERVNEQSRLMTRTGGVNFTFNANSRSPFQIFYGLEESDQAGVRRTLQRYSLRYDQAPGPNQLFSMFFGNVSWQHGRDETIRRENWSMRLEWQIKF